VFLSAVLPPLHLEGFRSTTYSTYSDNKSIDSGISHLIDPTKETQCKKIFGFDGLFCNPESTNGGIDVMYGLPSNSTCPGSGLTKSNGNLCLDKKTLDLMTSRGGNSTGANTTSTKDSQIA
jgi:hypothetical protein